MTMPLPTSFFLVACYIKVLSWLHPKNSASITRASQPNAGLVVKTRNKDDERYFQVPYYLWSVGVASFMLVQCSSSLFHSLWQQCKVVNILGYFHFWERFDQIKILSVFFSHVKRWKQYLADENLHVQAKSKQIGSHPY